MDSVKPMKKSDELKAKLKNLEDEYASLRAELGRLEKRKKEIDQRMRELYPVFNPQGGEVSRIKRQVDEALLIEGDEDGFVVEVSAHRTTLKYVVSRVTPKRIYIREAGKPHETILTRDGDFESSWSSYKVVNKSELVAHADSIGPKRAK